MRAHSLSSPQQAEVPTSKFLITSTLITQAILNTSHDLLYHTSGRPADPGGLGYTRRILLCHNTRTKIYTEKKKKDDTVRLRSCRSFFQLLFPVHSRLLLPLSCFLSPPPPLLQITVRRSFARCHLSLSLVKNLILVGLLC